MSEPSSRKLTYVCARCTRQGCTEHLYTTEKWCKAFVAPPKPASITVEQLKELTNSKRM